MEYMFYNCNSLISLNIEQFDLSSVSNLKYIFSKCSSLISLNLSNFYTINNTDNITGILTNCNPNLKYCINDNKTYDNRFLDSLKYFSKNCSELCIIMNKKKYIKDKYLCIDNCSSEALYEYNNICYEECPNNVECIPINSDIKTYDTTNIFNTDIEDTTNNINNEIITHDTTNILNTDIEDSTNNINNDIKTYNTTNNINTEIEDTTNNINNDIKTHDVTNNFNTDIEDSINNINGTMKEQNLVL
jgi:surface protein